MPSFSIHTHRHGCCNVSLCSVTCVIFTLIFIFILKYAKFSHTPPSSKCSEKQIALPPNSHYWLSQNLTSNSTIGLFDLKQLCKVYDIKVLQQRLESWRLCILSNRSRGTLMSFTYRSAQRCFTSSTPIVLIVMDSLLSLGESTY